jgi:DNA-binding MarR family transcriptional regulator
LDYTDPRRLSIELNPSKTITLTERDREDARRLLALLSEHDGEVAGSALPAALFQSIHAERERLREKARQILALRRKRNKRFSSAMFSEPAWEMLLALYASDGAGRLTVSGLALQSGSSKATALRWIDYLEQQGLIARDAHPTDQRVAFAKLTEQGKEALEGYLSDVTELGD